MGHYKRSLCQVDDGFLSSQRTAGVQRAQSGIMNTSRSTTSVRAWRRLWRPDRTAFWMTLLFNGASTAAVMWERHGGVQGLAQIGVLLLALVNSLLGLWWLKRLWQDDVPRGTKV